MNVLPVLLLLILQLTAIAHGETNQTATGSPAVSNVTTLAITPSNNNATSTGAGANATAATPAAAAKDKQLQVDTDKLAKVSGTAEHPQVLARGVTNTDTATVAVATGVTGTNDTQAAQEIKSTSTTVISKPTNPTTNTGKIVAEGVSMSDIKNSSSNSSSNNSTNNNNNSTPTPAVNGSAINSSSSSSSTTSTTLSPTTIKSTTTSTTTMRPKKPTVTASMDKQLEGEKLDAYAAGGGSVAPHVLPVQEMSSMPNRSENEYIVPIVTIMLAVPLAIAVFVLMYRRFRDLWTTRHYRRMDFLVDGMYND